MKQRIASAAVGIPILLGAVWLGSYWYAAVVFIAGAIAVLELARLVNLWGDRFHPSIPLVFTMIILVSGLSIALNDDVDKPGTFVNIAAVIFCPIAGWVLGSSRKLPVVDSSPAMILRISVYLGFSLYYALQLRALEDGREWTLLLLLVVFATDSFAYFFGRAIGRTPLAPNISPNKTWEGSVAGLVAAVIVCVLANNMLGLNAIMWEAVFLGAIIGVLGQIGDLVESRFKRKAGVKDSGWLIPGHGGILDRLDSIVFVLPATHLFIIWEVQQRGLLS